MGQFAYIIRPGRTDMLSVGPTEHETKLIDLHFNYLKGLFEAGTALFVGRSLAVDSQAFGIAVFEAENAEQAGMIMACDPAVQGGVFSAELVPFKVVFHR